MCLQERPGRYEYQPSGKTINRKMFFYPHCLQVVASSNNNLVQFSDSGTVIALPQNVNSESQWIVQNAKGPIN